MKVLCSVLFLLASASVCADATKNLDAGGMVLHGYDPVSYFQGEPAMGSENFSAVYEGAQYQFSSAENRQLFVDSPEKFAPKYGGYCAFGVRMGSKFDIDPEAFEIVDGRLYVLLNRATETLWLEDTDRNIKIADTLWPSIEAIPPEVLEEN